LSLHRGGKRRPLLGREPQVTTEVVESVGYARVGMKLNRFDRVLGLNRERLEKIYRGVDAATRPNSVPRAGDAARELGWHIPAP
jgi:hypothetical protein